MIYKCLWIYWYIYSVFIYMYNRYSSWVYYYIWIFYNKLLLVIWFSCSNIIVTSYKFELLEQFSNNSLKYFKITKYLIYQNYFGNRNCSVLRFWLNNIFLYFIFDLYLTRSYFQNFVAGINGRNVYSISLHALFY